MNSLIVRFAVATGGLLCFWATERAAQAQSPYVYGASTISVTQSVVNMWGYTEVDYASSYYYSVESDVFPQSALPGYYVTGWPSAAKSLTANAVINQTYWVQTNHWVIAAGSDPYGYQGIVPQNYSGPFQLYPTGKSGVAGKFYVASTYVFAYTTGQAPVISLVDETTNGNAQPGTSGYVSLFETGLDVNWSNSPNPTVSIPGIPFVLSYVTYGQLNLYYTIPAGTPVGPFTGSVTTPYGTGYFTFTVKSPNLTSQSITFQNITGATYGAGPVTMSATATSGLPVAFSSSTQSVCTVSGSSLSFVAAGSCSVAANQSGNSTYSAAPTVTQTITVAKGAQTISFGTLSNRAVGSAPFPVSATASSGLAVSFSASPSSVCTVSGSTVTLIAVGTCTVTASQPGNTNYLAASTVLQGFSVTTGGGSLKEYIHMGPRTIAIESQ